MSAAGILVAAPRSSSGKTTVTLALMRALARRGLAVRGAKCGPDYIDPPVHPAATGFPSVNHDTFAKGPPHAYLQMALAVLIAGLVLKLFHFLPHYVASGLVCAGGLAFSGLCYALYRTMMSVD